MDPHITRARLGMVQNGHAISAKNYFSKAKLEVRVLKKLTLRT